MAREGKKAGGSLIELVVIVAIALGVALAIQAFLVKPFRIPSESMVPTLEVGQRVLVDRISMRFSDPERGDVMVFKPPRGADEGMCGVSHPAEQPCPRATPGKSETNFIKRVIGLPGDRIAIRGGRAYVNGRELDEPYIEPDAQCALCNMPEEIVVPDGQYYMLGDNRGASADSREWGPVDRDYMIGNAFATYWPPSKWGGL